MNHDYGIIVGDQQGNYNNLLQPIFLVDIVELELQGFGVVGQDDYWSNQYDFDTDIYKLAAIPLYSVGSETWPWLEMQITFRVDNAYPNKCYIDLDHNFYEGEAFIRFLVYLYEK